MWSSSSYSKKLTERAFEQMRPHNCLIMIIIVIIIIIIIIIMMIIIKNLIMIIITIVQSVVRLFAWY